MQKSHNVCGKSSIEPRGGAYLNLETLERGLIRKGLNRKGGLFTKSNEREIYDRFSVLIPHILHIQHTIL